MIGFAGLGHMGTPMAGRLAAAGHRLRVYDIAPAARARHEGLDGVAVVSQVAEIADGADVVILMLPDSAVVAQVLLGDGLLEHVASSAVVVDMSSSEPERTRELARFLGGPTGWRFFDRRPDDPAGSPAPQIGPARGDDRRARRRRRGAGPRRSWNSGRHVGLPRRAEGRGRSCRSRR